jgi:hypothetical protein
VRSNFISCHLSVREHREENVDNIVGERFCRIRCSPGRE